MRAISQKIKSLILKDPFYKKCCLCGEKEKKIEWHHNLIYAGRQVDEVWAILPACVECHKKANNRETKDKFDFIMLTRATANDLMKYPRANWRQKLKYLVDKYGDKCIVAPAEKV